MTLWHIAWSYLWNRKFTTGMSIISLALSVALITTVLTLRDETRKRFEEEGQSFDMVVGAKGNPLQLVLSSAYFMDSPTGNIKLSDYERLKDEWEVEHAFPISMGDTFKSYRIVGTTRDFFEHEYRRGSGRQFEFADGRAFEKPMEAVFGAIVAQDTGLRVGDVFYSTHGSGPMAHEHSDHPYTLVGILERTGTPNDRAIFCDLQSIWDIHEDEEHHDEEHHDEHADDHHHAADDEITAVLLRLRSPAMRFQFRETVNENYNAMAVIPVNEIKKLYDQLLGTAKAVLMAIGYFVVVISSITIMIGLYMAILQRKRDLAIMRALGASQGEIFGSVIIEAFWVSVLGLMAGAALGAAACSVVSVWLVAKVGFRISAISWTGDLMTAYTVVLFVGLLAGIIPAIQAYRTNVVRNLAEL